MILPQWAQLAYLACAVMFIFGIKGMTHPRSARRGNIISSLGMLLAVIVTLAAADLLKWWLVIPALAVGSSVGALMATRVKMTAMPQMVALLNGFGGGASVLIAWTAVLDLDPKLFASTQTHIAAFLAGLIGAVTFLGSLVAYAKLQEIKQFKNPITFPGQQLVSALLTLIVIALGVAMVFRPEQGIWIYVLVILLAAILGVTLVTPIGGADMPVVICLLNSYSGLAGAATGFAIGNPILIIAGALVGASGIILTRIMCRAMNRSMFNVVFGRIDASAAIASEDTVYGGKIKSADADEVAILLHDARRVVIVPGYGMAVAQAQFAVRDLYRDLEERKIEVLFGIHPVAGRMPGHMNVLLAEVEIPYEKLLEMDHVNPLFQETDVVLVIGANDVVNPDARTNPTSPIAGMPILNVDEARTVVVIKRSLSPGFAGIPNPLFAMDNCLMYFADGKKAVLDLVNALKAV